MLKSYFGIYLNNKYIIYYHLCTFHKRYSVNMSKGC